MKKIFVLIIAACVMCSYADKDTIITDKAVTVTETIGKDNEDNKIVRITTYSFEETRIDTIRAGVKSTLEETIDKNRGVLEEVPFRSPELLTPTEASWEYTDKAVYEYNGNEYVILVVYADRPEQVWTFADDAYKESKRFVHDKQTIRALNKLCTEKKITRYQRATEAYFDGDMENGKWIVKNLSDENFSGIAKMIEQGQSKYDENFQTIQYTNTAYRPSYYNTSWNDDFVKCFELKSENLKKPFDKEFSENWKKWLRCWGDVFQYTYWEFNSMSKTNAQKVNEEVKYYNTWLENNLYAKKSMLSSDALINFTNSAAELRKWHIDYNIGTQMYLKPIVAPGFYKPKQ